MKLTKVQIKKHNQATDLLNKDKLTYDEKVFVFENWNEGANNINSQVGAFFTPFGLARDFVIEIYGDKLIDLCAGNGILSFMAYHNANIKDITCIELNHNYYEVGKKLLPEANWIHGSIFDDSIINSLPNFDQSISNPPFGKIKTIHGNYKLDYKGTEFEFKVIDLASKISDRGTFILPQMSTPYKFSGNNFYFEDKINNKVNKFIKETNLEFEFNCGIDTSFYLKDWKGVSPICEIVNFDFNKIPKQQKLF